MIQLDASNPIDRDTRTANMSSDPNAQTAQGHRGIAAGDGWNVTSAMAPGRGTSSPVGAVIDSSQSKGEALRSMGALSAPPPPGFNPDTGERSRTLADELLFTSSGTRPGEGSARGSK